MIGDLFGVGMSGTQINQLMKILAAIANIHQITILEDSSLNYLAFRLIDEGSDPKSETNECIFRFCLLTGIKESDFHNFIFYHEESSELLGNQDTIRNAKMRLRVLEYCLFEKYI